MNSIAIEHISHQFDDKAILQQVSFNVAPSELVCLVGPSGCGKSTLLRLIAGLENIQSGDVLVSGESIKHIPARKRNVGIVFQHPSLFPHLNVRDNITFGLHGASKQKKQDVSDELLEMIGLTKHADHYPHQLSGGQHQRVALARSLAPKPSIMLLDEPFANLDHALRCEIREELVQLLKKANIPIIMVTHDPEEALIMADKMVLMRANGAVHQMGEPDAIHNAPVDIEAAGFFGHINIIDAKVQGDVIASALADLPKNDFAPQANDGDKYLIATRPEGLRIATEGENCTPLTVQSFRHTGAGWLIKASLPSGETLHFHHIYGEHPQQGQSICVTYDINHVFVYGC